MKSYPFAALILMLLTFACAIGFHQGVNSVKPAEHIVYVTMTNTVYESDLINSNSLDPITIGYFIGRYFADHEFESRIVDHESIEHGIFDQGVITGMLMELKNPHLKRIGVDELDKLLWEQRRLAPETWLKARRAYFEYCMEEARKRTNFP